MSAEALKRAPEARALTERGGPGTPQSSRWRAVFRFVVLGAVIGLLVGFWEGGRLYFTPSTRAFLVVDATWIVWFIGAAFDLILFAFLGALAGGIAVAGRTPAPRRNAIGLAFLAGAAGAHVGWANHFIHTHAMNLQVWSGARSFIFPFVRFVAFFILALAAVRLSSKWLSGWFDSARRWPVRKMALTVAVAALVLAAGLLAYRDSPRPSFAAPLAAAPLEGSVPNIVLITLDTVRADHLSAYGYARPTTPNLDALARRGVLFENAIAPASWTLPSLGSIFTGLLPHQEGVDAGRPVDLGLMTTAEALRAQGYQTAGFNANYFYGQAGWGLGQGFQDYDDDRTSLRYNASRTLVGRALLQPVYQRVERYDAFYRRDAAELNDRVLRWFKGRRPGRFFLYINYFDAHSPYLAPPPYDHLFGKMTDALVRASFTPGFHRGTLGPTQQAALEAGYDDSLAYLDSQVGRLMEALSQSPDWRNTLVIITADHGEAFGDHGAYGHGCDLHREEIHVPLIVLGPGIPADKRVAATVSNRMLFGSLLDLVMGRPRALRGSSLVELWDGDAPSAGDTAVVSELGSSACRTGGPLISLTTSRWHYIHGQNGDEGLFDWSADPGERVNLSAAPEDEPILAEMRERLREAVGRSLKPWVGSEYLLALSGAELLLNQGRATPVSRAEPEPAGAAQAYVNPAWFSATANHPNPSQKELLQSLPYQ